MLRADRETFHVIAADFHKLRDMHEVVMQLARDHQNEFLAALARLEKCLETPIVPGELPSWLQAAREASRQFDPLFHQTVEQSHRELLGHTAREDPELSARVQRLAERDQELLDQWQQLHSELRRLCGQAEQAEPDEAAMQQPIGQFTDSTLALIIEVRKQDNAVSTWYVEAAQRDRGNVD
jgi:septal ring factor EnvC (AmiA/AmiB activator)